jgi:hypothetical protein
VTRLNVFDSPKMLIETLAVAQGRVGNSHYDEPRKREHIDRLQRLIDECERHRPTGRGGKHGDMHTLTCGCQVSRLRKVAALLRRHYSP